MNKYEIVAEQIPQTTTSSKTEWFVDVVENNSRKNIQVCKTEEEALLYLRKVLAA